VDERANALRTGGLPPSRARLVAPGRGWLTTCRHPLDFPPGLPGARLAQGAPGKGDVPLIHLRFRCSNCGSRLTDSLVTSKRKPRRNEPAPSDSRLIG
jgi:hypothetical protein